MLFWCNKITMERFLITLIKITISTDWPNGTMQLCWWNRHNICKKIFVCFLFLFFFSLLVNKNQPETIWSVRQDDDDSLDWCAFEINQKFQFWIIWLIEKIDLNLMNTLKRHNWFECCWVFVDIKYI